MDIRYITMEQHAQKKKKKMTRGFTLLLAALVASIALSLGSLALPLAGIAAWTPNALFSLIGLWLLRRASAI